MSRYKEICETLKSEIRIGKFEDGGVFPSERALMRRFSVARETVRHALAELRRNELLESRQGTLRVLSFRARERATGLFGLIIPDGYYEFYRRIAVSIEKTARQSAGGYAVLPAGFGTGDPLVQIDQVVKFAEICIREKVSGVFFQPLQLNKDSERVNKMILSLFDKADVPVVLIDSDIVPPPHRSKYDLVGADNISIGYELGRHVIGEGARHVIFVLKPYAAPTSLLRGYGVSLAATESGLPWDDNHVRFIDPEDISVVKRMMKSRVRPDAIIAANDYIASLLLKTLKAMNVRVPEDVILAGINGDSLSEESDPPITTARQDCEQIGEEAVHLMLRRINHPTHQPRIVNLSTELIIRRSTKRGRKGKE